MNYIREINAFYDLMEREPLSASAVNFWHTLLHINNKAGWADEFTVASTVLKLKGGLSESSFHRARKELQERGLIEYRSRGMNMAPVYRMKRLYRAYGERSNCESRDRNEEMRMTSVEGQVVGQVGDWTTQYKEGLTDHQTKPHAEVLIKQKEIKLKETKQKVEAVTFYEENFGSISPYVAEDILKWIGIVGEELVLEAMKRTLIRNRLSWGYVKSILKSWEKQGIRTVEAARADVLVVGKDRCNSQWSAGSREVVPDWFMEQKRQNRVRQEVGVTDEEKEKAAVILKQFGNGG